MAESLLKGVCPAWDGRESLIGVCAAWDGRESLERGVCWDGSRVS